MPGDKSQTLKVTSLDDLGDVVVLDKETSASSLLNMLRQRMAQPQENGKPQIRSANSGNQMK